jgi:serine/threonine-protein kinase
MTDLVGEILLGRYRIDAFLGRGGMAEVYRAWDAKRSVYVALKVLNTDLAEDYVFLRRFAREARALELLQHPHIVRFFGFEESEASAFLVMEYIDGVTLRRQLRLLGRPLSLLEVLTVLKPVCSALHYAHGMGVYHRDVKPANIFIERGGRVVLADFGIARLSESTTVTYSAPGTPAYMAPEQCRGGPVDERTDVYGLGISTYEMLTLDRPFKGDTEATTGSRRERVRWEQMHATPPQPRSVNPGILPRTERVLLRALEKEPRQRPGGVLVFYDEISDEGGWEAAARSLWQGEVETVGSAEPASVAPPWLEGRLGVAVGLIVLGGLLAVVLSYLLGRETGDARQAQPGQLAVSTHAVRILATPETVWPSLALSETAPLEGAPVTESITASTETVALPSPTLSTPAPLAGGMRIRTTDNMTMVYVPGGTFGMGSTEAEIGVAFKQCEQSIGHGECQRDWFQHESPQHFVTLSGFWIDQTEVSNKQYQLCVQAGVCSVLAGCSDDESVYDDAFEASHPVVCVSWSDAAAYCSWAGARLPTESEWEYAARGTESHLYPWGDVFDGTRLNFCDANCDYDWRQSKHDDGYSMTAPVTSYPGGGSWCGALNMAGNVGEWVLDWYGAYSSAPQSNPQGPPTGTKRVLRGGSWYSTAPGVRLASRSGEAPHNAYDSVGIRCAVTHW